MAESKIGKTPVIISIAAAGFLLFLLALKMEQKLTLSEGWNLVTYTGKEQLASDAFSSIEDYVVIAYYWGADQWQQIVSDTPMVTGMECHIQVIQTCVWSF